MKKLEEETLKRIKGGSTMSASLLNYIGDLITILVDAGRSLGSSIRRIGSNNICQIKE